MGNIIDGKAIAAGLYEEMQREVEQYGEQYGRRPGLTVIIVGEDPASQVYVRNRRLPPRKSAWSPRSSACRKPRRRRNSLT